MLLNEFYYIIDKDVTTDVSVVTVRFNPEHEIYKAHFPGRPITPGVCQIQMVTELLSLCLNAEVVLTDIKNVKYMAIMSPDEVTEMNVRFLKIAHVNDTCKVMVVFEKNERIFSKMSMTYHVVCNYSNI